MRFERPVSVLLPRALVMAVVVVLLLKLPLMEPPQGWLPLLLTFVAALEIAMMPRPRHELASGNVSSAAIHLLSFTCSSPLDFYVHHDSLRSCLLCASYLVVRVRLTSWLQ